MNIIQKELTLENGAQRATKTLYCAEGSVHLYSSEPFMLTPADLYKVKEDPTLRELVKNCNVYIITSRPRIFDSSRLRVGNQ
ncbi:hypothetical protein PO883_31340 [Massilia sp. DJPM01]|uniref:hypothetical protein n=1 Tax=Massilia sp. DJPM01 TaxID=3024404 RepID=UPI00259EAB14|nr:hypothetical protein [Massilia sp. DJPM01]MDM5181675.1 hypothetical protein [Massilia sp. DJPM01]